MAMNAYARSIDRPACQAVDLSRCSNCNMAYDCARIRSGRRFSWALVVLLALAVLVVLSKATAGL
jgi:hypothetical protein